MRKREEFNGTLGELIEERYPGFIRQYGNAPLDMDLSNGVEIETADNRDQGYGISVYIYPFFLWTDGLYKPVHYWGDKYELTLFKAH